MSTRELKASGLTLGYDRETAIVSGLDLNILPRRITALVGPNGCGKSTLLRGLGRVLRPQGGAVYLNGARIHEMPTRSVARQIGILPQGPVAPDGLTVRELVSLGRYPYQNWWRQNSAHDKQAIEMSLLTAGVAEWAERAVDTLSGGQKQRAWIAMALAQETDVLLLDEPTTFLDLAHQVEVLDLLWKLNRDQGRTVVMVLHDLNQASRYSDHIVMLSAGAVFAQGAPKAVIREDNIRRVFSLDCRVIDDPIFGAPLCLPLSCARTPHRPKAGLS
jgi:iron complex transport system ATP-binding protein